MTDDLDATIKSLRGSSQTKPPPLPSNSEKLGPLLGQSLVGVFLSTVWGRTLSALAALTMIGGIAAEGLSIYRSWQEAQIGANKILESKAEQCSKRAKYNVEYVPMNQWPEANALLDRECNPLYAEKQRTCDLKYKSLAENVTDIDGYISRLKDYKDEGCSFNEEQRKQVLAKTADLTASDLKRAKEKVAADAKIETATLAQPIEASPPKPVMFKSYDNTDMLGGDLPMLKDISLDDCVAACSKDNRCRAYSYDKWNRSCYPKSELHALSLTARSITAVRADDREPQHAETVVTFEHFRGRAFPRQQQDRKLAPSTAYCERKCAGADWCVAYTFYEATNECQLFKTTAVYSPDQGADSGAKIQAGR